jgi:HAD superfamily hydrolase (TIGR01548 family)
MIGRYAALTGATVLTTPWPTGPYPFDDLLRLVTDRTAMIAVVSPNNPTGAVATARDLQQLADAAPNAVLLVDLAYAEFADEDLTTAALSLPNAIVIRTFSKAFGLAGLRIGYALTSEPLARRMRACGSPYPVSALSIAAATEALCRRETWIPPVVGAVRAQRHQLASLLTNLGAKPIPSQGNFILAEFTNAEWTWRALGGLGIAVRRFNAGRTLDRSLRITCPGDEPAFNRLEAALQTVLRPEALLFDMDGVLADVSGSYRRAIQLTAESFGVTLTTADIAAAKSEPNSNNDWIVAQRLLARRGIDLPLATVTARFEAFYHGDDSTTGLEATERLIPDRQLLERLAKGLPLGIVTGRPRNDCDRFMSRFNLHDLFGTVICMEDGPAKPDSTVVRLALSRMNLRFAWMVGDTPDDLTAARTASVLPIGICPPGDTGDAAPALHRSGAARVLKALSELEDLLP